MNPSLFPPLPSWEGAHPIVVHLPLGVLAAAPLLALWAMLAGANRRTVGWALMLVMLLGAGGAVLAAASGEATLEVVHVPGEAGKTMERHEDLGELARNLLLGVAGAYALISIIALAMKDKLKRWVWVVVHVVWLAALLGAMGVLASAGHAGGLLVHEYGVTAPMGGK